MIKLTENAATQILKAAKESQAEGLALRIAGKREEDGSIQYAMGFEDAVKEDDTTVESEGVMVVVSSLSANLLEKLTVDYVELSPGDFQFIFLNPEDANFTPPKE